MNGFRSFPSTALALGLALLLLGCADSATDTKVRPADAEELDILLDSDLSEPDAAQDLPPSDLLETSGDSASEVEDSTDISLEVSDLADETEVSSADSLVDGDDADADATELAEVSPGEHVVEVSIVSGNDVISAYLMDPPSGSWNLFSGETGYWGRRSADPFVSYHTGLRFVGVDIPPGAEVLSATLSITPHNAVDKSHQLVLNVYAELQPDSAPFDPSNYDSGRPDQRLKTSAFVDRWVTRCAEPCNANIEYDCPQREADCWAPAVVYDVPKDLAALVQEVIELPGWQRGNALTVLVVNAAGDSSYDLGKYNDSRVVTGYVAAAPDTAPRLTVRFRVM